MQATPHPTDPPNMAWVPGGDFLMGSEDFYPEERPVHEVRVDSFWMDAHPVTVAEFARFVTATGHITMAEIAPDPAEFPGADPADLVPGSLVFTPPDRPVALDDFRAWWSWSPGTDWRHPNGPGSTTDGLDEHPVTHIAYPDAAAYAAWAGKQLPTEAQWEFAARGGLEGTVFAWGDEFAPEAKMMANTWQGDFPVHNDLLDGYARTSPVGEFPPNGYGLFDVIGNVWEWTTSHFTANHSATPAEGTDSPNCCGPQSATGQPITKVIKGGSHLCAPNYCLRYRPAARQLQTVDTSTSHLGFRCIILA